MEDTMSKDTYGEDSGIKYSINENNDEMDEKEVDDMDASDADVFDFDKSLMDDDVDEDLDDSVFFDDDESMSIVDDSEFFDSDESESVDIDEQRALRSSFSVISENERKYSWEKSSLSDREKGDFTDPSKADSTNRKRAKRIWKSDGDIEDEYYDLEIANNAPGLKIIMSVMFIIFIVTIAILVHQIMELNNGYQAAVTEMGHRPVDGDLENALAEIELRDQQIQQLTEELRQYRADEALATATTGDLIETPEGWIYIVAEGDTLGGIAHEHSVGIAQIMEWNGLSNPEQISVNQRLIVGLISEEPEENPYYSEGD